MELVAWWLSLLLILVLVIAGAVSRLRNKKRQPKITGTSLPVANSYRLIRCLNIKNTLGDTNI